MEEMRKRGKAEYSVAIRTLGLDREKLIRGLEAVMAQTVKPEKVVVYIAQGYEAPVERVGGEIYVETRKGMVAQRAVDYREIDTPLVLLLDDDVVLAPDSAERLLEGMESNGLDCIAADTFANHKLPFQAKLYAALTNLTFPHSRHDNAFLIRANGSFSYHSSPIKDVYPSQTAGGPCSLWKKEALLSTAFVEEEWMDRLGFAYNDDGMEFFKLHSNGGRLGVHFNSGVIHENAQTASNDYRNNPRRLAIRAKAIYLCWHRSLYMTSRNGRERATRSAAFWAKAAWLIPVHIATAVVMRQPSAVGQYIRGIREGIRFTRTPEYRNLPPYIK